MVDDRDHGQDTEDNQPEPEKHVDFLIDDIDGKNAESVMVLYGAGRAILAEGTFGDPEMEDFFQYLLRKVGHQERGYSDS